jgi:hypothetical protein
MPRAESSFGDVVDRFEVVAIGIGHERRIVVRVIVRSRFCRNKALW